MKRELIIRYKWELAGTLCPLCAGRLYKVVYIPKNSDTGERKCSKCSFARHVFMGENPIWGSFPDEKVKARGNG